MQQLEIRKELLTISDAAKILSVHKNTIRNMINRGELSAHRIGGRLIRIHKDELTAILSPYNA